MSKRSYEPDWKPQKRKRDPKVAKVLHLRGVICVLCGNPGSLHHVYKGGQGGDDDPRNMVGLCGDGVSGEHGLIEAGDVPTREKLGQHLVDHRPDTIFYILEKLGEEQGKEWLRQRLYIHI